MATSTLARRWPTWVAYADAEVQLTRAVELGGDEVKDAHRFLGAIYFQRGEREKAWPSSKPYLKLAPKAKDAEQSTPGDPSEQSVPKTTSAKYAAHKDLEYNARCLRIQASDYLYEYSKTRRAAAGLRSPDSDGNCPK